jgi:hypothetical protein
MKLWVIAFIISVILVIYAVPTFYDAATDRRILKTARIISKDLVSTRLSCLSKGTEYKVTFTVDGRQGYNIYSGDKILKTVYLDQIDPHVMFSTSFNDKGAVFENNTIIFKPVRNINEPVVAGYDSIFLNDKTREAKKNLKGVVRIYINKNSYEIRLLKVSKIKDNGDIVFN